MYFFNHTFHVEVYLTCVLEEVLFSGNKAVSEERGILFEIKELLLIMKFSSHET